MLKAPLRVLARLVRVLSARIMLRLANSRQADGLVIVDLTAGQQANGLFDNVERALRMIRDVDPLRFNRMCRDVRRVAVMQSHGSAGEFWPHYQAVALEVEHLQKERLDAICMTIVHEATHARLRRWGVRAGRNRERVERACVNQEIVFARKLPGTEALIRGALMKLETEWWREASSCRNYDLRLQKTGAPKWLRRILVWVDR